MILWIDQKHFLGEKSSKKVFEFSRSDFQSKFHMELTETKKKMSGSEAIRELVWKTKLKNFKKRFVVKVI